MASARAFESKHAGSARRARYNRELRPPIIELSRFFFQITAMTDNELRFITADGRFGALATIEYERALFQELSDAIARHGKRAIEREHAELIELSALGAKLGHTYGDFKILPSNRALIKQHHPHANLRARSGRMGLGVGLSGLGAPWARLSEQASDMTPGRVKLLRGDMRLLARIEELLPKAIASALSLGARKALATYQSPASERIQSFQKAVEEGGGFQCPTPTERFGRQDLFVLFCQMQGQDAHGGYLNASGYVVDDLTSARFFSSAAGAADFARETSARYANPPRWAVARFDASPVELLRPDGASVPELPLFNGVIAQAQAKALESETAPKAKPSARAARL